MSELIQLVARFVLSLFAVVLESLSAAAAEVPLAGRALLGSPFGAMTAEESQREIAVVGQVDVAGLAAALRVTQDAARVSLFNNGGMKPCTIQNSVAPSKPL